ncbi:unnamed protein product [Vitrella brassicaformis CCMP3155]|uniref:Uncharacterized protein n=1 Tax=Vitrella brassicaformis (strain CCMP3155) TaxID=1169540 RepID=A0A0G4EK56_VITBC|nr:unnamed protein product [Vitrella brassicaformis CCMP3155]|eukprot:CEL96791.1 unnamed protein product [Vitrella brassicaformis CCMP3155]
MDANEQRQLREDAQLASESLKRLMQLQTKVNEHLTQIKQRTEPANNDTVASTRELRVHLSLLTAQCNAAATQLSTVEPLLATAVDALIATAAEPPAEAPVDTVEEQPQAAPAERSYRLIYESGQLPINIGPARLRLSRDELSNVLGHLQPWELARHCRPLGTTLYHQSAANYTNLVIDCKDDKARRMWGTMPLAVAQRWGKRATNVALVEGHAVGRAEIAEKKRREREGGEGTAAAAAEQDDDGSWSADEGTLEVLSFEEVELDDSIRNDIPYPPPSSALPAAPSAPVHLPALKTVDNIPGVCLSAREGRQWLTPAVKTLIIRDLSAEVEGARAWVGDFEAIEVLELRWDDDDAASVLSALPADGKSLAALRTLRGVEMDSSPADIDRLREVLVARGVSRSLRELEIDQATGRRYWNRLQNTAQLVDAVAHPEALSQPIMRECDRDGQIDAEILSRSSSTGTPTVQKLVGELAKTAHIVAYRGFDEAVPAVITDDTFPAAHTLLLLNVALDDEAKKERAVEIASHMPNLSHIKGSDGDGQLLNAPAGDVWMFLERLQAALVSKGRERSLAVDLNPLTNEFADDHQSPCLWGRRTNDKLPPIEDVTIHVHGGVEDDELETFYLRVMASVASFSNELKGHKKTIVEFEDENGVRTDFERRFLAEQASLNFSGGPYKLSFDGDGLVVERRT